MRQSTRTLIRGHLPAFSCGFAPTVVLAVVAGVALVAGLIGWRWSVAARQSLFAERVTTARKQLRFSFDEKALESLSIPDDADAPAEYHYLKSLVLDRLQRSEPALVEIRRALEQSPNSPRFKALELKQRLFARERASIDQLIDLNKQYGSVGPVALFSTYAFQAKALLLEGERKPEAAKFHHDRRLQTLDTALTLSREMPELHPELLTFAIKSDRANEALALIDDMLRDEPESLGLRGRKVQVLTQLKRPNEAAELAHALFDETGRKLPEAEFYAGVLALADGSEEHDTQFQAVVRLYPRSVPIVTKHAVYLTRTGRINEAQQALGEALERQTDRRIREALAFTSITLPLEAGAPEVADAQLRKLSSELKDPLLVTYFEARIFYLKKQYSEALSRMLQIVKASGTSRGESRELAEEALKWVRTILADKVIAQQMAAVLRSTAQADASSAPVKVDGSAPRPSKAGAGQPEVHPTKTTAGPPAAPSLPELRPAGPTPGPASKPAPEPKASPVKPADPR